MVEISISVLRKVQKLTTIVTIMTIRLTTADTFRSSKLNWNYWKETKWNRKFLAHCLRHNTQLSYLKLYLSWSLAGTVWTEICTLYRVMFSRWQTYVGIKVKFAVTGNSVDEAGVHWTVRAGEVKSRSRQTPTPKRIVSLPEKRSNRSNL